MCGETTAETRFELDLQYYFGWLCKTERNIAFNLTFLKNNGADYALGQVIEIY